MKKTRTGWVRKKFAINNTNGYHLDAFLDCSSPAQVIQKLMVGSEGTLGYIAEVTFETLPLRPVHSTGLLIFSTLHDATTAAHRFIEIGAMAAELMDGRCLHLATSIPGVPKNWQAVSEAALAQKPFYPLTSTCCAFAAIEAAARRTHPLGDTAGSKFTNWPDARPASVRQSNL
jgi:FAD/FMN-containing dehydrogenase